MGVMLFEMAYGYLPFHSKSEAELKKDICNKELKLGMVEDNCGWYTSSEFKLLVAGCLRKNPENRLNLEGIREHVWWKKFRKNISQLSLVDVRNKDIF